MQDQGEVKSARNGLVRDIIVRRPNASRGDDEVVVVTHALDGFDDLGFVVGDDFDASQADAEGEAVFGEPGAVGVDCLRLIRSQRWVSQCVCVGLTDLAAEHFIADDETRRRVDRSLRSFGSHCAGCE